MINLTISEFARKYYNMGWNILPLFNNQKSPSSAHSIEGYNGRWEKYQSQRVTEEDFKKFFIDNKPTGIGVVTGLISGIVVIDEDFYMPGGKTLGIQSPLISKTTSGGRHVFLKTTTKIDSFVIKDSHIELQAEKRFIVLPPSVCWNKESPPILGVYEWDVARKEDLPIITAEELNKHKPQSTNTSVLLRDLMESGNGSRHNDLRTIALKMFNRFSQNEWDIAESFIRDAAKKTTPPYITPQEIGDMNKIIRDAKNLVLKNPKTIYIEEKKEKNLPNPVSMSFAYTERLEERKKEAVAPKTGYVELDEAISGWTPGFVYVLAGDTGVGKTALAVNIAVRCSANGGKILYYAVETGNEIIDVITSARLEKKYKELTEEDIMFDDPNIRLYRQEVVTLPDLITSLKKNSENFNLVIIDNITFFEEKSNNPTQAQLDLMRTMSKLAMEAQVAIIVIAHFNKSQLGKNIVTMDRISGSKAYQNFAKGVLLMKRNKKSDLPDEMEYLDDGILIVAKSKRGANKSFRLIFNNNSAVIKTNMDFVSGSLERAGF